MSAEPMVPVVRASAPPPPTAGGPGTSGGAKATSSANLAKILAGVAVLVVLAAIAFGVSQLLKPKGYEVGQCARVTSGILDDDMEIVDCPVDSYEQSGDIYRITEVIDHDDGYCSYSDITFSHEPHDKTYCLVYATVEAYE
jgi:hypothetical protein